MASTSVRKPPTCSRCRNHGIYDVQLKGHRNVCQYKHCTCKYCSLIVERRLVQVVIKPDRPKNDPQGKSSKKRRPAKKLEGVATKKKKTGVDAPERIMGESLPLSQQNGLLQVSATFTNARTFNAETQRSNAEHGTVNLPAQQPRPIPNYPSFNSPPHPYGYLHWSPRIRNFNPGASPNITVGAPAVSRMIASLPNQPNMFLNFPTTYQQVTTQDITTNSPPVNMSIQRPMDLY